MKNIFVVSILMLSMTACVHRQKILDATWVSMKYADVPDEAKLIRVAPVETKYCMNNWSGTYGLMDEVTKQAEAKFELDYIKNPSFIREENNCMILTGEGYRRSSVK